MHCTRADRDVSRVSGSWTDVNHGGVVGGDDDVDDGVGVVGHFEELWGSLNVLIWC